MPQTYTAAMDATLRVLVGAYDLAWERVLVEQDRVAQGIVTNPRLWRQRDRLAEIRQRIELEMNNVDALAAHWTSREFPSFYMAGAQEAATRLASPFAWTQTHREAVTLLAKDTFDDLLEATQHVREDAKRYLRMVTRTEVLTDQLLGKTAKQTARNVTRFLQARGITAVVYRNGARVGLASYADMAVRTKTAVAYNVGTFNQGAEFGVKFYEVFDGPSCGWTGHNDVDLANGSIRSAAEAATFVIAHPRCARSFGPRPDLTTPAQAKKAEPTAGGQAVDRPEAPGRPLEAAARTSAAREAAVARRTAAGLQDRTRTPQRVLERRAAMLQRVRLPLEARGPGRGRVEPPPPEPPAPQAVPAWRDELDQLLAQQPTWVQGTGAMDAATAAPTAQSLAQEAWVRQVGEVVDREVMRRADDFAATIRGGVDVPALRRELTRLAQEMDAFDTGWDRAANDLFGRKWAELTDRSQREAVLVRSRELSAERDKLRQARVALRQQIAVADNAHALGYRQAAREVLGEVRQMGTGKKDSWRWVDSKVKRHGKGATEAKKQLDDASQFFPQEWIDRANQTRSVRTGVIRRGHQLDHPWDGYTDVLLSPGREGALLATDSDMLSVATHELSHLMETVDPRVRALEHAFHYRRTEGMSEQLSTIYRGTTERGRKDGWSEHYMGKVYGQGNATSHWEHLSMGMEGIWTGRWRMVDPDLGDADYRHWVLGLLAGL